MVADVLVYGANGLVGRAIVEELLRAGLSVRALVRDLGKASPLRRLGAQVSAAALEDMSALCRAHEDVRVALLQLPAGMDPQVKRHLGADAVSAIEKAGVERVIYHASVQIPRRAGELPGFAVTEDIEEVVRGSSVDSVVIRPTFFLQNLLLPWVRQSITSRDALVYPVAADCELSWVAAEDVGRLAAAIMRDDSYDHAVDLAAVEAVNGDALARSYSQALGRHIEFVSLPLDQFEADVDAALGAGVGRRIGEIFRFIEKYPDDLDFVARTFTPSPIFPQFEPTGVTDWVRLHREAYASPR